MDEDFERWAEVKPEAVCGGSDAQAINVFREALLFIARCRVAIAAEREACAMIALEQTYTSRVDAASADIIAAAIRARGEK